MAPLVETVSEQSEPATEGVSGLALRVLRGVPAHPLFQATLIGALFFALRPVLTEWPARLRESAYDGPVLAWEAISTPRVAVALLLAIAVGVALRLRRVTWADVELRPLRWPVAAFAFTLGWTYAFYPYNFYLDRAHLLDRGLVLVLAIASVRHPSFFAAFLWMVLVVVGQLVKPLGFSWAELEMILDAAALLVVVFALRSLRLVTARAAVTALFVLIAAHYFNAAMLKWQIAGRSLRWPLDNDIAAFFVSSHVNGWLPDMSPATLVSVTSWVAAVAVPLQIATICLEVAGCFMLASRRYAIGLLLAWTAMHAGILLASGIFFLHWMVFDVACAVMLWRHGRAGVATPLLPSRWVVLVTAPLVVAGAAYTHIGNGLGWWDSRIAQHHHFFAVMDDGARYEIGEHELAPYDKYFAKDRFFFAHGEKQLTMTWGTTIDRSRYRSIARITSADAALKLIQRQGRAVPNASKRAALERFLVRVMRNKERAPDALLPRVLSFLSPPMHIIHGAPTPSRLPDWADMSGRRIDSVEIVLRDTWFDGVAPHLLRETTVRTIPIDASRARKRQPSKVPDDDEVPPTTPDDSTDGASADEDGDADGDGDAEGDVMDEEGRVRDRAPIPRTRDRAGPRMPRTVNPRD